MIFKCDRLKRLLELEFSNGVIRILILAINDCSEAFFTYLVMHECMSPFRGGHFILYVSIMRQLIESMNDLRVLCKNGIIDNRLGSKERTTNLFA